MRRPGELIQDAAYAYAHRVLEPRPAAARRLLLLLHGVGGDEAQLAALGARVDADTLVVLPRAQRAIRGHGLGWFREGFGPEGPAAVIAEAEESRRKLIALVAQLQSRHDVSPVRTVLAGFSQGGMLAASVALSAAGQLAGFAMFCGRLLAEVESQRAPRAQREQLDALVLHGRDDPVLPPDWAEHADTALNRLGVPHETRVYPAEHALTVEMRSDFLQWFGAAERRWNRAVEAP